MGRTTDFGLIVGRMEGFRLVGANVGIFDLTRAEIICELFVKSSESFAAVDRMKILKIGDIDSKEIY